VFAKPVTELKPTPAKPPPFRRIPVHVPPCTAELSLQAWGKAFSLLYVEGATPAKAPPLSGVVTRSIHLGEARLYLLDDVHASVFTSAKI
jgi:hypothetical protein